MLNPSTADAQADDPTIRRCTRFAMDWGYSRLVVRNLFAFRTSHPSELTEVEDPIGGRSGNRALAAARNSGTILVAWGAFVPLDGTTRAQRLLAQSNVYCLGTTANGHPRHPLYVRATQQPILYNWPT